MLWNLAIVKDFGIPEPVTWKKKNVMKFNLLSELSCEIS